ncbi:hypothetical protein AB0392_40590, partial [Nonomuraea angiospora]
MSDAARTGGAGAHGQAALQRGRPGTGVNGALTGTMSLTGLPVPQYPLMLAAVAVLSLAAGLLASGMALLPRPADALGG